MNARPTYLKGKSVFVVSLLVIITTVLTVYLTGENYNRTVTANLYISLSIIGGFLFLFMTCGLYFGIGLKDDFPKFGEYQVGGLSSDLRELIDVPSIEGGEGIEGLILSILLWIGTTILMFVLLILLEAIFWVSIFIILAMLYWVFFRALKVVFSKSKNTKGNLGASVIYSLAYTILYLGWMFGIAFLSEIMI